MEQSHVAESALPQEPEVLEQQQASIKKEKGGRPKSQCWKYYESAGKREDKSKREDVKCRYCATILAGRAEAMEKHIAQDCPHADPAAKAEMAHIAQIKAQSSKKGQKRKGDDCSMQQAQQQQAQQQHMEGLPPVMPLLEVAQQQAAANGAVVHSMAVPMEQPAPLLGAWPPNAGAAPAPESTAAEVLSLVIRNQVEMRSMLANIPVRLRNSKSCTSEAVLRPLYREKFHATSGAMPGALPPPGLFPPTWGDALRIDAYRIDQLRDFYSDDFGVALTDSQEEKQSKFLEWAGSVRP